MGTGLTGTLFVLDEPSIGLHPRDTGRLLDLLRELRAAGNTVLVVEHDETVIRSAENILELGPGSGGEGGQLLYAGPPAGLLKVKNSPTGAYLSGRRTIPLPSTRRPCPPKGHPWLRVQGADCHNLKNLTASFPLRRLVAVSGVSGSGKSTLVHEVIYKSLLHQMGRAVENLPSVKSITGHDTISDVLLVDQSPYPKLLAQPPSLPRYLRSRPRTLRLNRGSPKRRTRRIRLLLQRRRRSMRTLRRYGVRESLHAVSLGCLCYVPHL